VQGGHFSCQGTCLRQEEPASRAAREEGVGQLIYFFRTRKCCVDLALEAGARGRYLVFMKKQLGSRVVYCKRSRHAPSARLFSNGVTSRWLASWITSLSVSWQAISSNDADGGRRLYDRLDSTAIGSRGAS
jgi:hypothetical protein